MSTCDFSGAQRVQSLQNESIWVELSQLSANRKIVNLGFGCPDFAAPAQLTEALSKAALSDQIALNQYSRGYGHRRLVDALSKVFSREINYQLDPLSEIIVTIGADEALFCAIFGHINPGDEVIVFEPFFDCYEGHTKMAGGVPVFVPLKIKDSQSGIASSNQWYLDIAQLESSVTERTKMIVCNTPHNPTGKVFTLEELKAIAEIAIKHNLIVLMDEVYERLVYPGAKHIRMASFENMRDRTITVGSAGKTFSVTGWKIGWAYGAKELILPMKKVHDMSICSCPTPLQEAVAVAFETELKKMQNGEKTYWDELLEYLNENRCKLAQIVSATGLTPCIPESGYFMLVDVTKLKGKLQLDCELKKENFDHEVTLWLLKSKALQVVPLTSFLSSNHKKSCGDFIRLCFIKDRGTINSSKVIFDQLSSLI